MGGLTCEATIYPPNGVGNRTIRWCWEAQDTNDNTSIAPASESYDVTVTACMIFS